MALFIIRKQNPEIGIFILLNQRTLQTLFIDSQRFKILPFEDQSRRNV